MQLITKEIKAHVYIPLNTTNVHFQHCVILSLYYLYDHTQGAVYDAQVFCSNK